MQLDSDKPQDYQAQSDNLSYQFFKNAFDNDLYHDGPSESEPKVNDNYQELKEAL